MKNIKSFFSKVLFYIHLGYLFLKLFIAMSPDFLKYLYYKSVKYFYAIEDGIFNFILFIAFNSLIAWCVIIIILTILFIN